MTMQTLTAPERRPLLILAGLVLAGLVVLVIPVTAAVLIWPMLFVVPGWVVVRRVAPELPPPGALGVAIVTSVYASAHLVDLIARVVGFGRPTVIVSGIMLVLATIAFARVEHHWLAPVTRPSLRGVAETLRMDWPIWLVSLAIGGLIALVLFGNGWRETPDGWVSGGWDWSDLLVHVAIGASIIAGNFPPQVPYFAGEPLTYHWFADFHGAITASAAGIDIIPVYFATSAIFAGVLALVVWALALRLTGSRRVAVIAAILVCAGGGMGWLRLGADVIAAYGSGQPVDLGTLLPHLLSTNPYDNSWADGWPFFRIASVLGTGFLPHRATTLGLPGLVAVVLLVVTYLGQRPGAILLAGIIAALLAPFQFYVFPATYLIVALFVLASGAWRSFTVIPDAIRFLAPVVLAIPFVAGAIFQQSDSGGFRFVTGWGEGRFLDGPLAVVFFYATNLGIPFALAVVAALRPGTLPHRGFLVAWLVALFIIPNVVVLSAVEFDMNKYFQIMWIAVAILAAWLIARWPKGVIGAVLVVASISPALIAVWHLTNPSVTISLAQERAARWIQTNTPERSVFVTDAFINSPVDLAGRLRLTTFGPYVSNLGYDSSIREADVHSIYCDGADGAADRMTDYGATFVLSSGGALDCASGVPTDFASSARFATVYDQDGVSVWELRSP